jgi:hypothetical protein
MKISKGGFAETDAANLPILWPSKAAATKLLVCDAKAANR